MDINSEWGWEEETAIPEVPQLQHDQFDDVNFDDRLADTSLEHMPFDEPPPTIPSVDVETASKVGTPSQGAFDFQFEDMSFGNDELNTLAPVDQGLAVDFVNPQALFDDPNGPGADVPSQLNGDFMDLNTNGLSLPDSNSLGQNLTFPIPMPLVEPELQYLEPCLSSGPRPAPINHHVSNNYRNRHSSSASSWQTTPQIQHTVNPRERITLASRPPSPQLLPGSGPIYRAEFTYSGKSLDLRSDKIPRHTRNRAQKPDPREWYGPSPSKQSSWGPLDARDEPVFRYTQDGELEAGRFYSHTEMRQYLLGPKPSEKFVPPGLLGGVSLVKDKRRQGLTLWIGLRALSVTGGTRGWESQPKCRFRDCLHDNHTIRQGEYWVILDERMNKNGDVVNPFHNAGYIHLDCFEHFFDIVELWQHLDIRIDNRTFKYEEHGYFRLGRKHPRIVNQVAIWWKEEYGKWCEAMAKGSRRLRVFDSSLVSRLTKFDLEHESMGRRRARAARNGNDSSRHGGNVREQKRWRTFKDYGLLDEAGEPVPGANQKLQEYLTQGQTERKEQGDQSTALKQQNTTTHPAAFPNAPALGYPEHPVPSYGSNCGATHINHFPPVPFLLHPAYQTARPPTFPAITYSMYQQNMQYPSAVQFSPLDFQIQQPFPQPVCAPRGPLTPVPEEPSRKRDRDATEDTTEYSMPKRQRQELPATPSNIARPELAAPNEMQNEVVDNSESWMQTLMSEDFSLAPGVEETLDSLCSTLDKELDDFYDDGESNAPASNDADLPDTTTTDVPAGLAQEEVGSGYGDDASE